MMRAAGVLIVTAFHYQGWGIGLVLWVVNTFDMLLTMIASVTLIGVANKAGCALKNQGVGV